MTTLTAIAIIATLAIPGFGQEPPRGPVPTLSPDVQGLAIPPPASPTGGQPERAAPPPPPPAPPPPSERRPLPTRNVRVELVITDAEGSATPVRKVLSVVVADGRSAGIRSNAEGTLGSGENRQRKNLPLHVDVTPTVTPD